MDKELTKEEIEERAKELARRTMAQPPQPQEWPKKPTKAQSDAAKPRKRGRAGAAS